MNKPKATTHGSGSHRWLTTALLALPLLVIALSIGGPSRHASAGFVTTNNGESSVPREPSLLEGEIRVSDLFGNTCQAHVASQDRGQGLLSADAAAMSALGGDVQPIRKIEDPYPSFNGVAVDSANNLAMLSDSNRKSMLLYDRSSGDRSENETRPLRQLIGPKTLLGYIAGLTFDSNRREVYAVNNDIED
ncbi:MAG: hypothetical protein ACREA9_11825, partial [Pyrinomonadaceae bacterium]